MRIIKWGGIAILGIAFIIFSLVNRSAVTFSLFPLPFELQAPLFILLYITLFVGVLLGELFALLHGTKLRRQLKASEQRVKALESELLIKKMEQGNALSVR